MFESLIIPALLQIIGIIIVIAEIFIPSGGLLAVIALSFLGYSLYILFLKVSFFAGICFLLADIIIVPVVVVYGLKALSNSSLALKKTLSSKDGVCSQSFDLKNYIKKQGVALTDLRPAGVARIDGKRVDVVSFGEYIEKDSIVYVYNVAGNQVIVRSDLQKSEKV